MHYKMTTAAEDSATIAGSIGYGAAFISVGARERTEMATNSLMGCISDLLELSC
jgi:hypothetical protein